MSAIFMLAWIVAGLAGTHLAAALSDAHADMQKFTPDCVWFVLSGPFILALALFIALGYALGWDNGPAQQ